MINQLYDVLLHHRTKHTNMETPGSRYITAKIFPEQISDLLNTEVTLKYRNHYIVDDYDRPSSGRPEDDTEWSPRPDYGPESIDQSDVFEDKFIVIRADNAEPYRLIAISKDYKMILVNSTRKNDLNEYEFINKICEYPVQDNNFFGLEIQDQYAGEINELSAVSLRIDAGEPCYSVMVEFLGSTNYIRFVLGDEVFSAIRDIYDIDDEYDYDNKNASDDHGEYVDVDGYYADIASISSFKNIDGGRAGNIIALLKDRRAGDLDIEIDNYNFGDQDSYEDQNKANGNYNYGYMDDPGSEDAEGDYDFGEFNDNSEEVVDIDSKTNYVEIDKLVDWTDDEKAEFIRKLIEGKIIYGTV